MSDSLWLRGLWPTSLLCPWTLQIRILAWVAIPFSRRSSQPRDWTHVSHTAGRFFTIWATREAPRGNAKVWSNSRRICKYSKWALLMVRMLAVWVETVNQEWLLACQIEHPGRCWNERKEINGENTMWYVNRVERRQEFYFGHIWDAF